MNRNEKWNFSGAALILAFAFLAALTASAPGNARGGFGGGRGGGGYRPAGEFRGGGEVRGGGGEMRTNEFRGFDRGFDHPNEGGYGRDYGHEDGYGRDDGGFGHWDMDRDFARNPADTGVRNYGSQRNLASDGGFGGVFGAGAGALARGNQTWHASPNMLASQGLGVRNNFNNWGAFRGNWWHAYPNAWRGWGWGDSWPWGWASWGALAGLWGVGATEMPIYYDYGDNITYDEGGNVDYGSSSVCSASDYYQQAQDLSNSGQTDDFGSSAAPEEMTPPALAGSSQIKSTAKSNTTGSGDWQPFGVYSLVQKGQTNSTTLFQLCTNKKGQIRGNYYNALTNETEPVKGSVDKKRMRAAWIVGKESNVVYDTGVANLLKEQSPVLIHFGKDSTSQWTLVRIKNSPQESSKAKA